MELTVDNDEFFGYVLELLKEGKDVTIPLKGTSMLPLIRERKDTVVLEGVGRMTPDGVAERHVAPGEIVLFRAGGRYILHRILSIGEDGVALIQGDGVLRNRERALPDHIYGRVKTVLVGGRKPIDPYSAGRMRLYRLWMRFGFIRRLALGLYRRMPSVLGSHRTCMTRSRES